MNSYTFQGFIKGGGGQASQIYSPSPQGFNSGHAVHQVVVLRSMSVSTWAYCEVTPYLLPSALSVNWSWKIALAPLPKFKYCVNPFAGDKSRSHPNNAGDLVCSAPYMKIRGGGHLTPLGNAVNIFDTKGVNCCPPKSPTFNFCPPSARFLNEGLYMYTSIGQKLS